MIDLINSGIKNSRAVNGSYDKCMIILHEVASGSLYRLHTAPGAAQWSYITKDGSIVVITINREFGFLVHVELEKFAPHPSGNRVLTYSRKKTGYKGAVTALIDMLNMVAANENKGA